MCAWLIFVRSSVIPMPQVYARKPVVWAGCILLFFMAVVSPDCIFSSGTTHSVPISTPGHLPFPASLLKCHSPPSPTAISSLLHGSLHSQTVMTWNNFSNLPCVWIRAGSVPLTESSVCFPKRGWKTTGAASYSLGPWTSSFVGIPPLLAAGSSYFFCRHKLCFQQFSVLLSLKYKRNKLANVFEAGSGHP